MGKGGGRCCKQKSLAGSLKNIQGSTATSTSVELSPRITTFIPGTENFHSIFPAKGISPQDSVTGAKTGHSTNTPPRAIGDSVQAAHMQWLALAQSLLHQQLCFLVISARFSPMNLIYMLYFCCSPCSSRGRNLNKKRWPPEILSCKQDSSHPWPQGLNGEGPTPPAQPCLVVFLSCDLPRTNTTPQQSDRRHNAPAPAFPALQGKLGRERGES